MLAQLVDSNSHKLTEVEADAATVGRPLSAIRDERSYLLLGLVHAGVFTLGIGTDRLLPPGTACRSPSRCVRGRMISDKNAPERRTFADPEGNEVDLAVWMAD
jgi:hypothetical protein